MGGPGDDSSKAGTKALAKKAVGTFSSWTVEEWPLTDAGSDAGA